MLHVDPAAQAEPEFIEMPATEAPAFGYDEAGQPAAKLGEGESVVPQSDVSALPLPTNAAYEIANPSGDLTVFERSNRMIVKNADIRLMVDGYRCGDRSLDADRRRRWAGTSSVRGCGIRITTATT